MIVNMTRGFLGFLIVEYDTEQDTLFARLKDEYEGSAPAYWRPHPSNPNVLVGYVRDTYEEREWYGDPPTLVSYDRPVALKLLHASVEPAWDCQACDRLHQCGFSEHDGIPSIGQVNEMWHAREALAEWFAGKQLKLFSGEMAER